MPEGFWPDELSTKPGERITNTMQPPTDRDRERAQIILEYIANLRSLSRFVNEKDSRQGEIDFIATMLRNERHEAQNAPGQ